MPLHKTAAFYTLGCKLNHAETAAVARKLADTGYREVAFGTRADVYVINTCSVTQDANRECRRIVRKALRRAPDARVVVIGCYAQLKPNDIAAIDGVDLVLGASEKFKVPEYLAQYTDKLSETAVYTCDIGDANLFSHSYAFGNRTRAFLKVQDGCDYHCTFCTIPMARGRSRSPEISHLMEQAHRLVEEGAKEIVLTGVNIGDYGKGSGHQRRRHSNFFELLQSLETVNGVMRYRISSIEPNLLNKDIIRFVADSNKFAPHLHMPLQSGSNKILKRMRRRYLRERYAERVDAVRRTMPEACIGVDVITGFPGETEADFLETYHFLNKLDISYLHVFTYSERENTPAAKMDGMVPKPVRKARTRRLRILSDKKQRSFYAQQQGQVREVIFEGDRKVGFMHGFTDNYIKVRTPFAPELVNHAMPVPLDNLQHTPKYPVFETEMPVTQTVAS